MTARLDLLHTRAGATVVRHLVAAVQAVAESPLPRTVQELVKIRVSQINGCAFCVDMHTKEAAHAGEDPTRINLVAAWREATVFTDAERAALELAEQATRIADAAGGVPEGMWRAAAAHYDDEALAALVGLVAIMNAFNRGNVAVAQPAGDYRVGLPA
ncbi:carboxymuconolactone decarboxylase family protein [uncultured Mycolicibacterium sp.]|uniref:carboxymuconolactone decarboxylase family protein n=1 Tax=uncultured Mycolicibacterium sp. TaxID=2320817 RepID=UPI00262A9B55|nr:carboxymuconolactone decarboxylase family protein [uncultured Mycolicibacterium sp.]